MVYEVISISTKWNDSHINFVVVYHPPRTAFTTFKQDLQNLFEIMFTFSATTFYIGDFNVHVDLDDYYSREFKALLDACDLYQHVSHPTHVDGHTLDLIISPTDFEGIGNVSCIPGVSDHQCVCAKLDLPASVTNTPTVITYRPFYKLDINIVKNDILSSELYNSPASSAELAYKQYHNVLEQILDKYIPKCQKELPLREPKKWLNNSILLAKKLKRQAERTWRKNNNAINRARYRKQTKRNS